MERANKQNAKQERKLFLYVVFTNVSVRQTMSLLFKFTLRLYVKPCVVNPGSNGVRNGKAWPDEDIDIYGVDAHYNEMSKQLWTQ